MTIAEKEQKDIILFVGGVVEESMQAVREYAKLTNRKYRVAVFYPNKKAIPAADKGRMDIDIRLGVDNMDTEKIAEALLPYRNQIYLATCRSDKAIPLYAKIVPHLPYLKTPSAESLLWTADKVEMRTRLHSFDKSISPAFSIIADAKKQTLKQIKEKIGFPLVIKPASLAASMLVTLCFHEEEFEKSLKTIFKRIQQIYKDNGRTSEPKVLVEQFMEGDMYSVDAYVNSSGDVMCCPSVHIKTGHSIGFDDFFGYRQMTPTLLKKESTDALCEISAKAIHALALRNTTAHLEFIKTEDGFKVLELAARSGGIRHYMYAKSFGINHALNDLLVHAGKKPVMYKKVKGYSAYMKFFAKKEGTLKKLTGVKKIETVASVTDVAVNKKIGDRCVFAKNGGSSVVNVRLFNPLRSELLADIRRVEKELKIETV